MSNKKQLPPKGYKQWSQEDRFEHRNGPLFIHETYDPPKGQGLIRFFAEQKHCNGGGAIHGGMLMTFADGAMFAIAHKEFKGSFGVTVTMNNEFIYPGWPNQWIEATGKVTRATKSGMVFVRGELFTQDQILMTFSGLLKRIHKKPID
ncbi:MAG: PaaI family thioesterase [Robiginitomaculum sp.]|nr:PaaI family thioesterase [Robiginitomaculum sp.]